MKSDFTRVMKTRVREETMDFSALYTRADVRRALRDVQEAKEDNLLFRLDKLERICATLSIDADQLLLEEDEANVEKLLEHLPDGAGLTEDMLTLLYDVFQTASPGTPEAYIRRLVQNLAPEYADDPTRVAILKCAIRGCWAEPRKRSCKALRTEHVVKFLCERMDAETKRAFKHAANLDEKKALLLSEVTDEVFVLCGPERSGEQSESDTRPSGFLRLVIMVNEVKKYRREPDKYFLLRGDRREPISDLDLSEETLQQIASLLTPEELPAAPLVGVVAIEALINAVLKGKGRDRLLRESGIYETIEAEFLALCRQVQTTGKQSALTNYGGSQKDYLKNHAWGEILQWCDDMAKGWFRVSMKRRSPRRDLYYLAFVLGMNVSLDQDQRSPQDFRDVEKNLFEDFYADNLLGYLGNYDKNYMQGLEKEPTGAGIDWKNYAEVIYLYCLWQMAEDQDAGRRSPGQWIDRAEELISRCEKAALNRPREDRLEELDQTTNTYRGTTVVENLFDEEDADEDEEFFLNYMVNNFVIISPVTGKPTGLDYAHPQLTARTRIAEQIERLDPEEFRRTKGNLVDRISLMIDQMIRLHAADEVFVRVANTLNDRVAHSYLGNTQEEIWAMIYVIGVLLRQNRQNLAELRQNIKAEYNVELKKSEIESIIKILGQGELQRPGLGFALDIRRGREAASVNWSAVQDQDVYRQRFLAMNPAQRNRWERRRDDFWKSFLQFCYQTAGRVTRTDFIINHLPGFLTSLSPRDYAFPEFLREFHNYMNPELRDSRFQQIQEKNFLDMLLACVAFQEKNTGCL